MKSKQLVVVEAWVPESGPAPPDPDAHPEHPIYIPIDPPPDVGLFPEHPIYLPVPPPSEGDAHPEHPIYIPVPPPTGDLRPEHPIYWPVYPAHPIVLPPNSGLDEDEREALRDFLLGHLPPASQPV